MLNPNVQAFLEPLQHACGTQHTPESNLNLPRREVSLFRGCESQGFPFLEAGQTVVGRFRVWGWSSAPFTDRPHRIMGYLRVFQGSLGFCFLCPIRSGFEFGSRCF